MMARVAVLVVSYYSADEVEGFIASTSEGIAGIDFDVHVIDNSGDAEEIARLASMPGIARFLPSGENLGYGAGINRLVTTLDTSYDWYLVCNPDIRFDAGSIGVLVAAAAENPRVALAGPRISDSHGNVYPSARSFPSIRTGVGHALFVNLWPGNPWTRRYRRVERNTTTENLTVDWLSGACLLIRPEAFEDVGGFDEGYFMYFEDVDLARRLAARDWSVLYVPSAHITHSGAHSTVKRAEVMRRVHHESAERYLSTKYRGPLLAPVRVALRIGLAVRRDWFRG